MNTENANTEFLGRNMTRIFIAVFVAIIIVLLAVVIIMLGIKMDSDTPEQMSDSVPAESGDDGENVDPTITSALDDVVDMPELMLISTKENGDKIMLETTYCTVSYPMMFTELIKTEVYFGDGTGCIMFFAELNHKSVPVFTVLFNSSEGVDVGTLEIDGAAAPLRVSVVFYEPSGDITGDDMTSYYAASETFNDVAKSLEENEGFTSAY